MRRSQRLFKHSLRIGWWWVSGRDKPVTYQSPASNCSSRENGTSDTFLSTKLVCKFAGMNERRVVKRPRKPPEYNEGKRAADAFGTAMDAVLTVSKPRILALEKRSLKKSKRRK